MSRKKTIDPALVESISKNIFCVMPLLRKRPLHMDVIQSKHDIPLSHVQVLSMLNEAGSMSVSEISQRLGIAKPNLTPLVDRLIENDYVDRIRDTRDRRIVNVVILENGRQKLHDIEDTISLQITEWTQALTVSDFRELAQSLDALKRILSQLQQ